MVLVLGNYCRVVRKSSNMQVMLNFLHLSVQVLIFHVFVQGALADLAVFECSSNLLAPEKAEAILTRIDTNYKTVVTYKAQFTQYSYLAALETSEISSGNMVFDKPGKMRWDYVEPSPQVFLLDGVNLWLYQPEQNQVLVDKFSSAFVSDLPVSFLLGLGSLRESFSIVRSCLADSGYVLQLSPIRARSDELSTLKLLVGKDLVVRGAAVSDIASNVTAFIFKEIVLNKEVAPNLFEKNWPDTVDLIDRRKEQLD